MTELSYDTLVNLVSRRFGKYDVACPLCGPERRSLANRKRRFFASGTSRKASRHAPAPDVPNGATRGPSGSLHPNKLARQDANQGSLSRQRMMISVLASNLHCNYGRAPAPSEAR